MKTFTHPDFQTQLDKRISDLEVASQIEVVVIIKQKSASYEDVPLGVAAIFSLLTLGYLFFVDTHFDEQIVFFSLIAAFGLGELLGLIPFVQRLLVGKKRKQRNVEIMARALFQKGGLHHTSTKTGTLIYYSLLEQMVYMVADRGAQMAIPDEEWQKINTDLAAIFKTKNPPEALLIELTKCKDLFNRYIPALENNINELPNDLKVDL